MDEQLRAYEGPGLLHYSDGSSIACTAIAAQDHDGSVTLACTITDAAPPPQWVAEILGQGERPTRFEGSTTGLPMVLSGGLHAADGRWSSSSGAHLTYHLSGPTRLEVGTPGQGADTLWRFGITNLLFDSPELTDRPDGGLSRSRMRLVLGGQLVDLERSSHYEAATQDLKRRRRIRVTAEAVVPGTMDFASARQLVGALCSLLSISQGTHINWILLRRSRPAARLFLRLPHELEARPDHLPERFDPPYRSGRRRRAESDCG